jgi:hypothetical protein
MLHICDFRKTGFHSRQKICENRGAKLTLQLPAVVASLIR